MEMGKKKVSSSQPTRAEEKCEQNKRENVCVCQKGRQAQRDRSETAADDGFGTVAKVSARTRAKGTKTIVSYC